MSFCGIYQIKNTVNGKKYIGKSVDIEKRLKRHLIELRKGYHNNKHLMNAFDKYGEDVFKASIIAICPKKDLNVFEQWFINIEGCANPEFGYNKTFGGDGCEGYQMSDETREKLSKSKNSSGFRNVYRNYNGWAFSYYKKGRRKRIYAYSLIELKSKIEEKGFELRVINEENAKKSLQFDEKKGENSMNNSAGFFRVSRKGKYWQYRYYQNKQRKCIYSKTIEDLESKIKSLGLEWRIVDNDRAQKSLELDIEALK